jgi:hypothetical protein
MFDKGKTYKIPVTFHLFRIDFLVFYHRISTAFLNQQGLFLHMLTIFVNFRAMLLLIAICKLIHFFTSHYFAF